MNDKLVFPTPDTINKITPCEDWSKEDRKMKLCTKQSIFNIIQWDLLVNKLRRSHGSKRITMMSPRMIHKITPSLVYNYCLDTQIINLPIKVVKPTNKTLL